jgi:hypothetical protein
MGNGFLCVETFSAMGAYFCHYMYDPNPKIAINIPLLISCFYDVLKDGMTISLNASRYPVVIWQVGY